MDPADTPEAPPADPAARPRPSSAQGRTAVGVTVAALLLVVIVIYGVTRSTGKLVAHTGACARSLDVADRLAPLVHGDVAALTLAQEPHDLSKLAFDDADGRSTTLGAFKGRSVLLNLWATWCAPCRAEMPSLDALQKAHASPAFSVVPVNVDTVRLDKAQGFFKDTGATDLPYYADNSADILQALRKDVPLQGLPTTILVGGDGCVVATMNGPADWNSPDAVALIDKLAAVEPKRPS